MKKLVLLGCLSLCLVACEKKIPVFGDKNVPASFELLAIADTIGTDYSEWVASATVKDTVLKSAPNAKLITLPLYKFKKRENLVSVHFHSNTRWGVLTAFELEKPEFRGRWFINEKKKFVGEAVAKHTIPQNTANNTRPIIQIYYATRDSAVIYKLIITQMGKREDPD